MLTTALSLSKFRSYQNGVLTAVIVAVAARFISEHYGAPAMLMGLLLGIAFQFLHEEENCRAGIEFSARGLLRLGVALLGIRISWQLLSELGIGVATLVISSVLLTIFLGLIGARLFGRGWRFGLLTGGAVAICGASAALAITALLPQNEHSERNLTFTVIAVTVLSTIAMIIYPIAASYLSLDPRDAGIFIGGTIHDVAQVVGAGYTISDETGDVATIVKLLRVSLLAPMIFGISLAINLAGRDDATPRVSTPLMPTFVLAFLIIAMVNSVVSIPEYITSFVSELSRWLLLVAVSAVGMKTSLRQIRDVGGQAIILIVSETIILGMIILGAIYFL